MLDNNNHDIGVNLTTSKEEVEKGEIVYKCHRPKGRLKKN